MALPRFMYDDPSKHVDFIRKQRKEYKERQPESKAERARRGLKKLFDEGKQRE